VNAARGSGRALARTALAGNPSDLYSGAVLAVTRPEWSAQATVEDGDAAIPPDNPLVAATVRRFARAHEPAALGVRVDWSTSIPQRVGLGSSSALVIAVSRALCERFATALSAEQLAEFALAVESEELGIVAGLQDRVAQSFEGLTFMDFGGERSYESLDPGLLPPLVVAWREDAAGHSGNLHQALRARLARGEPGLVETVSELAQTARDARAALLAGDGPGFAACVDRSLDLRGRMVGLDPLCLEMVQAARSRGAAANYTGSGGAIVAVCDGRGQVESVVSALQAVGASVAPPKSVG
jgi:glucuronokinase